MQGFLLLPFTATQRFMGETVLAGACVDNMNIHSTVRCWRVGMLLSRRCCSTARDRLRIRRYDEIPEMIVED
jgi:hypothetical protein